ncbi:MFS transporter, partial [Streptomyces sp. NPDC020125]
VVGSMVPGVSGGFTPRGGVPGPAAARADDSIGGAVEAAAALPSETGTALLATARDAFVGSMRIAAGVGAGVLLATAVAAWFLLRRQRLAD